MFKINKKVSAEIIQSTKAFHVGDFCYQGSHYYVKPDQEKVEILAYYLAKLAKLPALFYKSVSVRNVNYSVSLDMREKGSFLLAEDLFGNVYSIRSILEKIRSLTFYTKKIEFDFYQMYFFDLLFLNSDRYPRNFGFWKVNEQWNLVMFDHKMLFDVRGLIALRFNYEGNFTLKTFYQDVSEFFSYLPDEVIEKFQEMLVTYNIDVVRNVIRQINPSMEEYYMNIYISHYEKIANLLSRGVNYGR